MNDADDKTWQITKLTRMVEIMRQRFNEKELVDIAIDGESRAKEQYVERHPRGDIPGPRSHYLVHEEVDYEIAVPDEYDPTPEELAEGGLHDSDDAEQRDLNRAEAFFLLDTLNYVSLDIAERWVTKL